MISEAMDSEKGPKSERTYASDVSNAEVVDGAGSLKMEEGRLWGSAIVHEFKSTVGTWWVKDMTTFNQRTVAVSLLLFLTAFAPTVTFGAVYGKVTDNRIGAVETIVATAWVGVAYSLIGGMPMVSKQQIQLYRMMFQRTNIFLSVSLDPPAPCSPSRAPSSASAIAWMCLTLLLMFGCPCGLSSTRFCQASLISAESYGCVPDLPMKYSLF